MPPEVFLEFKYSQFSDVYAFGIVLYEIITGIKPYKNMNHFQIFEKRVKGEDPLFEYDQPVEMQYRDLIERCISLNPENRPTFDEIVEELKTDKFITEKINKNDYFEYIEFIESYPITFEKCKIINIEDYIIKMQNDNLKRVDISRYIEKAEQKESKFKSFFSNLFGTKKENLYPIEEFKKLNEDCQYLVVQAEDDAEIQRTIGMDLIEGKNAFPKNIELGIKYLENSISN